MFVVLSLKEEGYANESGLFERLQISIRWKNALVKWGLKMYGVYEEIAFQGQGNYLNKANQHFMKLHNTNFKNSWNLRRISFSRS